MSEGIRINKYLAECGICSRREADKLIESGHVTVNGNPAAPGLSVTEEDEVCVDGSPVRKEERKVVIAFYKPVGVTCSEKDRHAESLVTDYVKTDVRVTYAGRLDKDSEGLLLLTNDGDLINRMMRGALRHEKEYEVTVNREISEEFLEKMRAGLYLKDLGVKTRPCKAVATGKRSFTLILTQGLNRQIRRMCEACGYHVRTLKRIRVMNVTLGNLKPGEYRELTPEELRELYH